jgi:hypothetical protein
MKTITFKKTKAMQSVLDCYENARIKLSDIDVTQTIRVDDKKDGWSQYFGLSHHEGKLYGLELPSQGEFKKQLMSLNNLSEKDKKDVQFLLNAYFTAEQYIKDNQKRSIFSKANLDNLSHGKTLAMLLVMHMSFKGLKEKSKRETYGERIKTFSKNLLQNKEITKSTSNDSILVSCQTALLRIQGFKSEKVIEENILKDYCKNIKNTTESLNEILNKIDDELLQLITSEDISVAKIRLLEKQNGLGKEEKKLKENELIKSLFISPNDSINTDVYMNYYDGFKYDLNKTASFLVEKFNKNQKNNLVILLQERDRLRILQSELKALLKEKETQKGDSSYLQLSHAYLNKIKNTKFNLNMSYRQFKEDCQHVYYKRQQGSLSKERKNWESRYVTCIDNKTSDEMKKLNEHIAKAMSCYTGNFINSFEALKKNEGVRSKRAENLLGIRGGATLDVKYDAINKSEKSEFERQQQLMHMGFKNTLKKYGELIKQATELGYTEIACDLTCKKESMQEFIGKLKMDADKKDTISLDDWVMVEAPTKISQDIGYCEKFYRLFKNESRHRDELKSLEKQLEDKDKAIIEKDERISGLESNKQELTAEVASLTTENAELKKQLAALKVKKNEIIKTQVIAAIGKIKMSMKDGFFFTTSKYKKEILNDLQKALKDAKDNTVGDVIDDFLNSTNPGQQYKDTVTGEIFSKKQVLTENRTLFFASSAGRSTTSQAIKDLKEKFKDVNLGDSSNSILSPR